jgi:deoxyribonuclease-4
LNFAKDASQEYPYWIDAMVKELQIADMIGAEGCVLHLGKAVSQSQEKAVDNMHKNVCRLLDRVQALGIKAKLFLETSSGQGTEILATSNNTIQELADFFKMFDKKYHDNLSFCVDTCHIYAAGYDIGTSKNVNAFFEEWNLKIGMRFIGLVHFNNSVHGLGSRKDRHACINFGKIPIDGLVTFGKMAIENGIPLVLETPAGPLEIPLLHEIANKDAFTSTMHTMVNISLCQPKKKVVKKLV